VAASGENRSGKDVHLADGPPHRRIGARLRSDEPDELSRRRKTMVSMALFAPLAGGIG
jgi:hypothetical protein